LPILPVINKINDKSIIPISIIKTVRDLVAIRNKQVHVGLKPSNPTKIEKMLEDVKDLLLLLDYYSGYDFSLSFVRMETRQQLK
jgi:hypothetical protein